MRTNIQATVLAILAGLLAAEAARAASDNFSTNPLIGGSPWSFGVGSNGNSQFSWSPGELSVHVDSSLPTARFDLPLGATLNDTSSFVLSARFSFSIASAPSNQFAQISFGLANHTLTGGDRTGTPADFNSANTYHTIEFDYYPNDSSFGGRTLSPAVFGGPAGSAFNNFASIFGPDSSLGDNTIGVHELPQNTLLETQLAYDGPTKTLTLSMYQVQPDTSLTPINTELVPLAIVSPFTSYNSLNPFQVDSLSIMAYFDAFTTSQAPSLVADLTFESIGLVLVPEPSALVLAVLGATAIALATRRRHCGNLIRSTN